MQGALPPFYILSWRSPLTQSKVYLHLLSIFGLHTQPSITQVYVCTDGHNEFRLNVNALNSLCPFCLQILPLFVNSVKSYAYDSSTVECQLYGVQTQTSARTSKVLLHKWCTSAYICDQKTSIKCSLDLKLCDAAVNKSGHTFAAAGLIDPPTLANWLTSLILLLIKMKYKYVRKRTHGVTRTESSPEFDLWPLWRTREFPGWGFPDFF
jgi:hypothetical protein